MKNKYSLPSMPVVFFVFTLVLAFLSWIGNIHGWPSVQSLLSEEGVRWALNHVVIDYVQSPALGIVLIMFMGVGIGVRASFYNACMRIFKPGVALSGKERRSLVLSGVVGFCYVLMVLFSISFLRSVTGSLLHSPFHQGFFYILSFGLGLMGLVYGYASNNYRRVRQVVEGMCCLISRYAEYFVTLFFVVQFFSVLLYTQLALYVGVSHSAVEIVFAICCYLPLFFHFVGYSKSNTSSY